MPCPKNCGANKYGDVNRHVMNNLNTRIFKCLHKGCPDKIAYNKYVEHAKTCIHGIIIQKCTNSDCISKTQKLTDKINKL